MSDDDGIGLNGFNPESLAALKSDVTSARTRLYAYLMKVCPGEHHTVQHRDGKPPWCPHCGRDAQGEQRA